MSKIILCGEAWGAKEDLFRHPFVGTSGAELARMLAEAGLAPPPIKFPSELDMIAYWARLGADHDISLANVFAARPEDNKIEHFFCPVKDSEAVTILPPMSFGTTKKYLRRCMLPHVEALWETIREARPNLVIALGNTSCWALLGESKITALRGVTKVSKRLAVKVLPIFHPAYILRVWKDRTIALADLQKALAEAEFPELRRIERWLTIEPSLAEIEEWITRDAAFYAVDIETAVDDIPLGQITMIGLARNPHDALVIPFADRRKANWNYWPNPSDELCAWRLAEKVLQRPIPKVFQNGTYDLSYLFRAGLRPTQCYGDTMLLHHSMFPEMLKSLGFLGSIYSREVNWKKMRTKGHNLMKRDE